MLTKAQVKFIKSLQEKKYRKLEQCFLVEGEKSVLELLKSDFTTKFIVCTEAFWASYKHEIGESVYYLTSETQLAALGEFKSNNAAIGVASIRHFNIKDYQPQQLQLVLDNIQDPGNLGTIIRTADWYGVKNIIVSDDTVEFYNPKVIASTKGSFTRVRIYYTNLIEWLTNHEGYSVYGALLGGENIRNVSINKNSILIIGNEAHGIRPELLPFIQNKISIPKFGEAESLNAAIATAILLDRMIQ